MAKITARMTVTRLRQGIDGKPGEDAYSVDMTPLDVLFAEGIAGTAYVDVYAYQGDRMLAYNDNEYSCSTLGSGSDLVAGKLQWSWQMAARDYHFRYKLTYTGEGPLDESYPVTVTLPDGTTRQRTLRVRTIANGKTYKPVRCRPWDTVPVHTAVDPEAAILYPGDREDDPYTDIVFTQNSDGSVGTYYLCVAECSRVIASQPGDARYSGKLQPTAQYSCISTGIILAQNGVINLLQGNKILLGTGTNFRVGLQGGSDTDIRMFAGSATPANAPFRLYDDGSVYCNKGTFEGDVVFGGRIVPMRTVITKDNYKQYRGGEPGNYYLDFRTLTGHVTLDASLDNVSLDDFAMIFYVASKYPDQSPMVENIDDYVGSRLVVKNNTSSDAVASGYVSPTIDNPGAYSAFVHPGNEIRLFCFVAKNSSNKKVIGWHVEYVGPQ